MAVYTHAAHCHFRLMCYKSNHFFRTVASRFAPAVKKDIKPTYWCALCRENGALEIYSVPDFKLAFCVRNFAFAPKVLVDSGSTGLVLGYCTW